MTVSRQSITRQTGIALWRQIADHIRQAIANGEYSESGYLPAEFRLAEDFGVNRHTVRKALADLAAEGLVRSVQGIGTAIEAGARFSFPIGRRTRFSTGLTGQVRDTDMHLLASAIEKAGPQQRSALGLAEGDEVVRLEILSSASGRPISRSTNWFPAARFSAMPEHFRKTRSITRALALCGVEDYVRVTTEITARHADADETSHLGLSPGSIILETQAVNADLSGRTIQMAKTRFAADRVKLTVDTSDPQAAQHGLP